MFKAFWAFVSSFVVFFPFLELACNLAGLKKGAELRIKVGTIHLDRKFSKDVTKVLQRPFLYILIKVFRAILTLENQFSYYSVGNENV